MVFIENKICFGKSNEIIVKLFKLINEFIDKIDYDVIYKRKTDFRSAFCYGLLYTRKNSDQLQTSNIINIARGFKTHQSSFKKRLDTIDFTVFDDLINQLCKFDIENFKYEKEAIAIDGSKSQIITNEIPLKNLEKIDISDDLSPLTKKSLHFKCHKYKFEKDINFNNDPNDIIKFSCNPSKESISIPITGVYNVVRNLPLTLELAQTKDERKAFADFLKNKRKLLDHFKNAILIYDRGYPSYKLMAFLINSGFSFIFRLPQQFGITDSEKKPRKTKKNLNTKSKTEPIQTNNQKELIQINNQEEANVT